MARIRSVKPEFWGDRKLARLLSRDARLLYIALWNQADEHGRLQGDSRYIKGTCLPYDDDLSLDDIDRLVVELIAAGRVQRYDFEGDPFLYLPKLSTHQRLEPGKVTSRLPEPPPMSDSDHDPHAHATLSARGADEVAPDADTNALLYVAGSREHVAGSRGARRTDACAEPTDDPTSALVAEHAQAYAQVPPPSALIPVRREVMRLVSEHVEPDRIRAGLAKLREKGLAASLLPQLVTEATQPRKSSNPNEALLARARERAAKAEAQPARKALP